MNYKEIAFRNKLIISYMAKYIATKKLSKEEELFILQLLYWLID